MTTRTTVDPIEATTKAVDTLLTALAGTPTKGANIAFRAAITRHGRNLLAQAGPEGLATVLARIRADAPDKAAAEERERIVLQAWEPIMQGKAA